MSFFSQGGNIRNGVMKVIESRIAEAQKAHDKECEDLERKCAQEKLQAEARCNQAKKASESNLISNILGKVI